MRISRRAAVVAAVVISALPVVAACGAGQDSASRKIDTPADGVITSTGDVRILNALVVAAPSGDTGTIAMTIANNGTQPDELVGLTSSVGSVQVTGRTQIPAAATLGLVSGGTTQATITGLSAKPGETIQLTARFAQAGEVTFGVPIYPAQSYFASLAPSASASPSAVTPPASTRPTVSGTPVATVPLPSNSASAPLATTVSPSAG